MAKKNKVKSGTAIWINEIGAIKERVFTIKKKEKEKVLIVFKNNESCWIKKENIRGKRVIIYRTANNKLISQNPDNWGRIKLKKMGIKTLRFNLQNSSLQESKSAIHRWTTPRDVVDKLGPIFKLMFICIAVGVMAWASLKFAGTALQAITRSRLMSCEELLPKIVQPVGALINNTVPIAA